MGIITQDKVRVNTKNVTLLLLFALFSAVLCYLVHIGQKDAFSAKTDVGKSQSIAFSKREKVLDDKPLLLRITEGVGGAAGAAITICDTIAGLIDHISVALEKGAFGWRV